MLPLFGILVFPIKTITLPKNMIKLVKLLHKHM